MNLVAVCQGSSGFPGADAPRRAAPPSGQPGAVLQALRFGRELSVTRSAQRAVAGLRGAVPSPRAGNRLGLILATDRGDQHVLARRLGEVAGLAGRNGRVPTDLFRAICYFPVGRVLKSVAEALGASGPVAAMPADLERARALAEIWLAAGRADLVAVVAAEALADGARAEATAALWQGRHRPPGSQALSVTRYAERRHDSEGTSCAAMTGEVIESVAPAQAARTALVVGSMLADAGESLFAALSPRDPGPGLQQGIRSLANRIGFSETFILVGSSGATMTALALAQDLVALNRADRVVVCGVDLVHGALAHALGLLGCADLPHMRGEAIAVLLERPAGAATGEFPALTTCELVSPVVPARPGEPMDLGSLSLPPPPDAVPPERVLLSGLTSLDLGCARQLAESVWPYAAVSAPADMRGVGTDVLQLLGQSSGQAPPLGIAAVHSLGGTGWCLLS